MHVFSSWLAAHFNAVSDCILQPIYDELVETERKRACPSGSAARAQPDERFTGP
jgi:hypothetical protein